ncbi:MAG: M48 family metalloprotease [Planctomycetales bacterium]|nr:M48 family metalloprotease [Planctomycetales bacterium]
MITDWVSDITRLSEDFSLTVAVTLLHFLWQGCVIGLVVFILNGLLQGASASSRYALHTTALLLLPLCVVITFLTTRLPDNLRAGNSVAGVAENIFRGEPPTTIPAQSRNGSTETTDTVPSNGEGSLATTPPASIHQSQNVHSSLPPVNPQQIHGRIHGTEVAGLVYWLVAKTAPIVAVFYFAGVSLFLMRLVLALRGGHRLRSASNPMGDPNLKRLVVLQAQKLGLRMTPIVRLCERVSVPVVVGVLHPVILVPASLMTGLAPEQFAAIISHELAHVRRYDLVMNVLQRVIESLLFFHPVVWYISRCMSAEREICCDDLVVFSGCQRMDYAGALLRVAELCAANLSADAHTLAASGSRPSELKSRIWRLMQTNQQSHLRMTRTGTLMIALLTLTVLGMPMIARGLAAPKPLSGAQNLAADETRNPLPDTQVDHQNTQDGPQADSTGRRPNQPMSPTTAVWVQENVGYDPIFLPDGRRLLTGTTIRDVATGKAIGELDLDPNLHGLGITKRSANGRFLLLGWSQPITSPSLDIPPVQLQVLDLTTLKPIGSRISVPHRFSVGRHNVDVSSDGKYVVAVSWDSLATGIGEKGVIYDPATDQMKPSRPKNEIVIWNTESGEKQTHAYKGIGSQVSAVALSPDGQWMVIAEQDKLTFWKWKTDEETEAFPMNDRITSLAFSADSRHLAEGPRSPSADIQVHDMPAWKNWFAFKNPDKPPMLINTNALTFTRDGKRLIAGNGISADELKRPQRVYVWDVQSRELVQQIETPDYQVWSLDVTPDGTKIAARLVDDDKSMVVMWDISSDKTTAGIESGETSTEEIATKGHDDRNAAIETFARNLRTAAPVDWSVQQKDRAFRLLGPETAKESDRARLLLWFDDVSIASSDLRKRDRSAMEIGHLDNTQIGRLYVSRNTAARELWPEAYLAIRRIEPVEHVAFADLDNLNNIDWFDAAYVRDVSIDQHGKIERLLSGRFTTESGISAETKFLVIGRVPDLSDAVSQTDHEVAVRFKESLDILKTAAGKLGVQVLSVDEFRTYTRQRLESGRGYRTRWVTDPSLIQPPKCLLTGDGLKELLRQPESP